MKNALLNINQLLQLYKYKNRLRWLLNVRLAGDHLYGKLLFTWLSLVVSVVVSFVLFFFPRGVLGGVLGLVGSVSGGFPSYLCTTRTAWSKSDQAVRTVHSCNSW